MPDIRLFPPLLGVSENLGFTDQEPGTCRDALNVRSAEANIGRTRLVRRPGLKLFSASQVSASYKVAWMEQVVFNNLVVDYADDNTGTVSWTQSTPQSKGAFQMVMSPQGDLFLLEDTRNTFHKINPDGGLISSTAIPTPGGDSNDTANVIAVDSFGDVFVGLGGNSANLVGHIFRFQLQPDGLYKLIWQLNGSSAGGTAPNDVAEVKAMVVKHGRLYTFQQNAAGDALLRVYDNIYNTDPPIEASVDTTILAAADPAGLDVNDAGEIFLAYELTALTDSFLRKLDASGNSVWVLQASVGGIGGGIGTSVVVKDDKIWTMGQQHGGDTKFLRQWTDPGASGPGAANWTVTDTSGGTYGVFYRRLVVDAYDNVHVPFPRSASGAWKEYRMYDSSGNLDFSYDYSGPVSAVALPISNPDYAGSTTPPTRPEFVYLVGQGSDLTKLGIVSVAASTGSTRSVTYVAAAGDDVVTFDTTGPTTPTGGSGALDGDAHYVHMATAFSKVFGTDGVSPYFQYDPAADEVTDWISTSSGEIPKHCQLVEMWNGRMVLAGDATNRHLWYMSAQGDPGNWDFFPPTVTGKVAIASSTAPNIGEIPDVVNTIIPYNNDILLFGCDHSIYMVRGDPAQGGSMDAVNTTIGMSWGKPWCIGPDGVLYFSKSRGGIARMNPYTGEVVDLSIDRIENSLMDVDLSSFHVRLFWDHVNYGVGVFVIPYRTGGTIVKHWFWSQRHNAWWPDQFGDADNTGGQPCSVLVADADDPDDRFVLIGGEDGYVYKLDAATTQDTVVAGAVLINAYALIGPIQDSERNRDAKLKSLWAVLETTSGPCLWEVYASKSADYLPSLPVRSGVFMPGRNNKVSVRVKAPCLWIKIGSSNKDVAFALESLTATLETGSIVRSAV